MIESEMYGWSCGDYKSGVSLGYDLRQNQTLALSAFDVAGNLLNICCQCGWVRTTKNA